MSNYLNINDNMIAGLNAIKSIRGKTIEDSDEIEIVEITAKHAVRDLEEIRNMVNNQDKRGRQ